MGNRLLAMAAILVVVLGGLWFAHQAFMTRHWEEFNAAGDRSFGRQNYPYAEKMYREALQRVPVDELHDYGKHQDREQEAAQIAQVFHPNFPPVDNCVRPQRELEPGRTCPSIGCPAGAIEGGLR